MRSTPTLHTLHLNRTPEVIWVFGQPKLVAAGMAGLATRGLLTELLAKAITPIGQE
jgi:hypothetical protein